MSIHKPYYSQYVAILRRELVPAAGCTEPVSIALAAAKAVEILGDSPDSIHIGCSANIIKNARTVAIPNSDGLFGIEAAAAMGAFAGDASKEMEVLVHATPSQVNAAKAFLSRNACTIALLESDCPLHITVQVEKGGRSAFVEIKHAHNHIELIKRDGVAIYDAQTQEAPDDLDYGALNLKDIFEFAQTAPLEDIQPIFQPQVHMNYAIAVEGMSGKYGVGIGPEILSAEGYTLEGKMRAYTAAASEARMCGCSMPVVICSGSGNQGISSSLPVIIYCRENGFSEETMYRALALSNLLTLYQKYFIGKLSAFCGAVSATCASGAAVAYLRGATLAQIEGTINNTLANTAGIVCDGAKPSCAAKINSGLSASLLGCRLAMAERAYEPGSGIVKENAEATIAAVGQLACRGMRQTDDEIVRILLNTSPL